MVCHLLTCQYQCSGLFPLDQTLCCLNARTGCVLKQGAGNSDFPSGFPSIQSDTNSKKQSIQKKVSHLEWSNPFCVRPNCCVFFEGTLSEGGFSFWCPFKPPRERVEGTPLAAIAPLQVGTWGTTTCRAPSPPSISDGTASDPGSFGWWAPRFRTPSCLVC